MNEAQEVMNRVDPSIRVEVDHSGSYVYIRSFDTTVTPNHIQEWVVPLIPYEEFYDWVFTEGQARCIVDYWQYKRKHRGEVNHTIDASRLIRLDYEIKQLEKQKEEVLRTSSPEVLAAFNKYLETGKHYFP